MVKINFLPTANDDLKEIFSYISKDSKRYAKFQIERILEKINLLKTLPKIGKSVEEIKQKEIKELVEGDYRIIYRIVNKKQIDILMVHHGARNLAKRI